MTACQLGIIGCNCSAGGVSVQLQYLTINTETKLAAALPTGAGGNVSTTQGSWPGNRQILGQCKRQRAFAVTANATVLALRKGTNLCSRQQETFDVSSKYSHYSLVFAGCA